MLNTENHHLIMCEIYNSFIHGQHFLKEYETEDVDGHYLVYCKFDFQKEKNIWKNIRKTEIWLSNVYKNIIEQQQMKINHDFIRNYKNIIQRGCRPEIAKIIYLQGGECIAILKTFWIRLIQRTWKNVFKKRIYKIVF